MKKLLFILLLGTTFASCKNKDSYSTAAFLNKEEVSILEAIKNYHGAADILVQKGDYLDGSTYPNVRPENVIKLTILDATSPSMQDNEATQTACRAAFIGFAKKLEELKYDLIQVQFGKKQGILGNSMELNGRVYVKRIIPSEDNSQTACYYFVNSVYSKTGNSILFEPPNPEIERFYQNINGQYMNIPINDSPPYMKNGQVVTFIE